MNSRVSAVSSVLFCGFLACAFGTPNVHGALLDGKVMKAVLFHQSTSSTPETSVDSGDFLVGPGVELPGFGFKEIPEPLPALVDIDISDRQILITLVMDQPLAFQERLHFIGDPLTFPFFPNLRGVSVNSATNWAGFIPGRVSLGGILAVNLSGLSGLEGQQILLDVVPEPAAAGLLLAGMGAVIPLPRRRVGSQAY